MVVIVFSQNKMKYVFCNIRRGIEALMHYETTGEVSKVPIIE